MTGTLFAQESARLLLRLNRDFGSAFGSRIQGTFSFRVDGPNDLVRVVFLIDGESIGEDDEAPWRSQFRTDDYVDGLHRMSAIGYTADDQELRSNEIQRVFISDRQAGQYVLTLLVPVAILIIGGYALTAWIANRGRQQSGRPPASGILGGAVCPNCRHPYALHLWGINLVAGRLDRCPHCGKWALVRRASPEALQAAVELWNEEGKPSDSAAPLSDEERLRRDLDESRFDDAP